MGLPEWEAHDDEAPSLREEWEGYEALAGVQLDHEHNDEDEPDSTWLLHRRQPHYVEVMWVRAYRAAKTIVLTFPTVSVIVEGVVERELMASVNFHPVGAADAATPGLFLQHAEKLVSVYEQHDWVRKEHHVRTEGQAS